MESLGWSQKDAMCSLGINGVGELRGQLANSGSPGKMAVKNRVAKTARFFL